MVEEFRGLLLMHIHNLLLRQRKDVRRHGRLGLRQTLKRHTPRVNPHLAQLLNNLGRLLLLLRLGRPGPLVLLLAVLGHGRGPRRRRILDLDEHLALERLRAGELLGVGVELGGEHAGPDLVHDAHHGELLGGAAVDFDADDDGEVADDKGGLADGDADGAEGDLLGEGVAVQDARFDEGGVWVLWVMLVVLMLMLRVMMVVLFLGRPVADGGLLQLARNSLLEPAQFTLLLLLPLRLLLPPQGHDDLIVTTTITRLNIRLLAIPHIDLDAPPPTQQHIRVRLGRAITVQLVPGQVGVVARVDKVAGQRVGEVLLSRRG